MALTLFYNVGSLALGFGAWVLACCAIKSKKTCVSYRLSAYSFSVCALSLLLQLFEVSNRVNRRDFAAIEDTIRAVILAACVLISITIILNTVAAKNRNDLWT